MFSSIEGYEKFNLYENNFMSIWENNDLANETENTKKLDSYACFKLCVERMLLDKISWMKMHLFFFLLLYKTNAYK